MDLSSTTDALYVCVRGDLGHLGYLDLLEDQAKMAHQEKMEQQAKRDREGKTYATSITLSETTNK